MSDDGSSPPECPGDGYVEYVLTLLVSSLSVLGSLSIIVSYLANSKAYRNKQLRKMLFFLSIMDIFASVCYLLTPFVVQFGDPPTVINHSFCVAQAAISTFGNMSSFLMTSLIGLYLYQAVRSSSRGDGTAFRFIHRHVLLLSMVLCLGLPLALVVVVLLNDRFGYAEEFGETWCWISVKKQDGAAITEEEERLVLAWRFVGGKAVEVLTFVCIFVLYIPTLIKLRSMNLNRSHGINKLSVITGLFVVIRFPSFIRTLVDAFGGWDYCIPYLSTLESLCDPSQGLLNGLVYTACSRAERDLICRLFSSLFRFLPCRPSSPESKPQSSPVKPPNPSNPTKGSSQPHHAGTVHSAASHQSLEDAEDSQALVGRATSNDYDEEYYSDEEGDYPDVGPDPNLQSAAPRETAGGDAFQKLDVGDGNAEAIRQPLLATDV